MKIYVVLCLGHGRELATCSNESQLRTSRLRWKKHARFRIASSIHRWQITASKKRPQFQSETFFKRVPLFPPRQQAQPIPVHLVWLFPRLLEIERYLNVRRRWCSPTFAPSQLRPNSLVGGTCPLCRVITVKCRVHQGGQQKPSRTTVLTSQGSFPLRSENKCLQITVRYPSTVGWQAVAQAGASLARHNASSFGFISPTSITAAVNQKCSQRWPLNCEPTPLWKLFVWSYNSNMTFCLIKHPIYQAALCGTLSTSNICNPFVGLLCVEVRVPCAVS